jgi:hypothetical protein
VSSLELRFEGVLPRPPRRSVEDVAKCLGWSYEGVEAGRHVLTIPLDVPLLNSPKVYIREEPGRYVGRGSVPAGELTFETLIEKAGEAYRWLFRGVQRGLINTLGRQFFEGLASRLVERIVRCL